MLQLASQRSIQSSTPEFKNMGYTQIYFGENQLSPCSIGISPLATTHPSHLQLTLVRASTLISQSFTLVMVSSHGFGSSPFCIYFAQFNARFHSASGRCRPQTAKWRNSPVHSSIGTRSPSEAFSFAVCQIIVLSNIYHLRGPKPRSAPTACQRPISVTFHSPSGVLFHLSLTVLVHYRSQHIFSLSSWSSWIPAGFRVSRGTWDTSRVIFSFAYESFTPYGQPFQIVLLPKINPTLKSRNPQPFSNIKSRYLTY